MRRPPWEARATEVFVERGKAAPKARRHKVPPEAGRLLKNDHLESKQLEHTRQVRHLNFWAR